MAGGMAAPAPLNVPAHIEVQSHTPGLSYMFRQNPAQAENQLWVPLWELQASWPSLITIFPCQVLPTHRLPPSPCHSASRENPPDQVVSSLLSLLCTIFRRPHPDFGLLLTPSASICSSLWTIALGLLGPALLHIRELICLDFDTPA